MSDKKYEKFVFFSTGPVGEQAIILDYANRFYESTSIPSTIIMERPNSFLKDLSIPYDDHIEYLDMVHLDGIMDVVKFVLGSVSKRYCYVNVLPVQTSASFKMFAYFIRFFTKSRFVGFNLEDSKSFPLGRGSFYFLGKGNYISSEVDKELFYEQANRMLSFLGFSPVSRTPVLEYVKNDKVFERYFLEKGKYLVFHIRSSRPDRSFPVDRWKTILCEIKKSLPGVKIVFTGGPDDELFIDDILKSIGYDNTAMMCAADSQEILNVYANAKLNVTVHTGNAILINMLHVPALIFNIKGVHMFKYYFNEKSTEVVSEEDCECDPLERQCKLINYNGSQYMACLFNTKDEDAVKAVLTKWNSLK